MPFWPPEGRDDAVALHDPVLAPDGREIEVTLVRKDGERFHASLTCSRPAAQDGSPLGFVATVRNISERKRAERELEHKATRDGLTGLLNRAAFLDRLRDAVAEARAAGRPLTLALLDLDRFKAINDKHGHPVGDQVLRDTAERLRAQSRAGDLEELYRLADVALYRARALGRNRCVRHEPV